MNRQDAKALMARTRPPIPPEPCFSWRFGVLAVHRLAAPRTADDANSKCDCPVDTAGRDERDWLEHGGFNAPEPVRPVRNR